MEKFNLQNKLKAHADRFYESIGHTKRNLQSGFVSNLLTKSTNEVIDEKFLSHDVTTLCIDDTKRTLGRVILVRIKLQSLKNVNIEYYFLLSIELYFFVIVGRYKHSAESDRGYLRHPVRVFVQGAL